MAVVEMQPYSIVTHRVDLDNIDVRPNNRGRGFSTAVTFDFSGWGVLAQELTGKREFLPIVKFNQQSLLFLQ
jgi:hypothetical protein